MRSCVTQKNGEKNLKCKIICAKMHPGYIVNAFLRVCKKVDYALSSKICVLWTVGHIEGLL